MPEKPVKPEIAKGKEKEKKKEFVKFKPNKMCPKCNSRMAEHSDRFTCGKCAYTEFKPKK